MAVSIIPTRSDIAAYFFKVRLDDVLFQLAFQHNNREDRWYLDLRTADGVPIRSGIKLVSNFPLLRLVAQASRPPGELVVINTVSDNDPALRDLGDLIKLAYVGATGD